MGWEGGREGERDNFNKEHLKTGGVYWYWEITQLSTAQLKHGIYISAHMKISQRVSYHSLTHSLAPGPNYTLPLWSLNHTLNLVVLLQPPRWWCLQLATHVGTYSQQHTSTSVTVLLDQGFSSSMLQHIQTSWPTDVTSSVKHWDTNREGRWSGQLLLDLFSMFI